MYTNFKFSETSKIFNKFVAYYTEYVYENVYSSFSELRYYWWRKVKNDKLTCVSRDVDLFWCSGCLAPLILIMCFYYVKFVRQLQYMLYENVTTGWTEQSKVVEQMLLRILWKAKIVHAVYF